MNRETKRETMERMKTLMRRLAFPPYAVEFLAASGEKLSVYAEQVLPYYESSGYDDQLLMKMSRQAAAKTDLSCWTVHAVFLLMESLKAESLYKKLDPSGQLYTDTFEDLAFKIRECVEVKGVIGIFPVGWYHIFFQGKIVRLGRLEYELTTLPAVLAPAGAAPVPAVSIHIPSSGESFDRRIRHRSYDLAGVFFREKWPDYFPDDVPAFCESWLLYPGYHDVFPKGSNLLDFMDDFALREVIPDPAFYDAWRIFGAYGGADPELLPEKTRLQKAMKEYLRSMGATGCGLGTRWL